MNGRKKRKNVPVKKAGGSKDARYPSGLQLFLVWTGEHKWGCQHSYPPKDKAHMAHPSIASRGGCYFRCHLHSHRRKDKVAKCLGLWNETVSSDLKWASKCAIVKADSHPAWWAREDKVIQCKQIRYQKKNLKGGLWLVELPFPFWHSSFIPLLLCTLSSVSSRANKKKATDFWWL